MAGRRAASGEWLSCFVVLVPLDEREGSPSVARPYGAHPEPTDP
jgi:hypothetical protein